MHSIYSCNATKILDIVLIQTFNR